MPLHVSSTMRSSSGGQDCITQPSVIVMLEQVSALKLLKYDSINMSKIVAKFMCEFFGCDYCVLLTVNMLCHVEGMFIQLLNL